ncbi:type II restriction endonuclease [Kosakonia quasisacchari]|uniref:Type II restriction endonuclease n=1 Tax=Kosakonia quasisacchari TaxID=2529380 RepID=A0A4R0GSL6_9ENTR|nr:type II restriction endonuclease [Kosakonia quasisacchari]TCC00855.1 type II restriction endonuclease [Kosakonia quasisacchari]
MTAAIRFRASCIKTLSSVEANPEKSHQHEFNGVKELKALLGIDEFKCDAKFSIRGSQVSNRAQVTWYDARTSHLSRSEYRLYFTQNEVMDNAAEGDNIIIGYDTNDNLQIILIKIGTASHEGLIKNWREN